MFPKGASANPLRKSLCFSASKMVKRSDTPTGIREATSPEGSRPQFISNRYRYKPSASPYCSFEDVFRAFASVCRASARHKHFDKCSLREHFSNSEYIFNGVMFVYYLFLCKELTKKRYKSE